MNRKFAPDLNIIGKNSLRTNADFAKGKVQPLPELNSNFQIPRPKEYSSGQANSKKVPITEIPMSKTKIPGLQANWSLVPGYLVLHWILVFGTWNIYMAFLAVYIYYTKSVGRMVQSVGGLRWRIFLSRITQSITKMILIKGERIYA